jgi:RNA polymerase sigma factor (sigma-70 family)
MFEPEFNEFLSGLIHAGHESPPSHFKERAMELIKELIPFDGALWASGRGHERTVHNVYLYGLPQELMQSYENIKGQDRILSRLIENPGITVDMLECYDPEERKHLELYTDHSKRFGIEAVISTALPDEDLGLLEVMSLYRNTASPAFSARERQIKQTLFPFMNQVWHHNQIQSLKHACGCARKGTAAICDGQGWLRHAESKFTGLLRSEFPDWKAPELPAPLRDWLIQSDELEYLGKLVVFNKEIQNDLTLLQARSRGALAELSPREAQIAENFAAGLTYKEIAAELKVSTSTVRRHLESIYRKLNISSKVELANVLNGSGQAV